MMDKRKMMNIGKKIKYVRKRAGMTQEELAYQIGVSRTAIARWELGEIEPKIKNLIALSEKLNVSADYLLGIEKAGDLYELGITEEAYNTFKKLVSEIRKTGD